MPKGKKRPAEEWEGAPSPFMTIGEVAALLRMSYTSVYKGLVKGDIPGFQINSMWRCRRDQIEAMGLPPKDSDSG